MNLTERLDDIEIRAQVRLAGNHGSAGASKIVGQALEEVKQLLQGAPNIEAVLYNENDIDAAFKFGKEQALKVTAEQLLQTARDAAQWLRAIKNMTDSQRNGPLAHNCNKALELIGAIVYACKLMRDRAGEFTGTKNGPQTLRVSSCAEAEAAGRNAMPAQNAAVGADELNERELTRLALFIVSLDCGHPRDETSAEAAINYIKELREEQHRLKGNLAEIRKALDCSYADQGKHWIASLR